MDIKQDAINAEEMAKRLNTTSSNIRKWCIELEKHGYKFVKDNRKKRYYSVTDQTLLSNLKYAIQEKKLPLEIAAMTVIKGFDRNHSSSSTQEEHLFNEENNRELNIPQEHENYTKDVVLDTLKQQQSVNNKLLEMLDHYKNALKISERRRQTEQEQTSKQLKELEERLAERISQQINNRDKEMMDYIRQSQRQNQQQLLEIVAIKEKKQQKSFFARLFGK
ncbi:hypothetical protein [Priestia megaterium]|uniref:hypothetical protein n=1 Tax=Priestia megaterium TaxID=1404 RepID=UPI0018687B2F|nr:hypothetical protein [Priestia megaterium]MBE2977717.1 hypothetical protein [Priestia megaterium]